MNSRKQKEAAPSAPTDRTAESWKNMATIIPALTSTINRIEVQHENF